MSVILIGYRGSGKTSLGRKLADRLWQPFVDSDEQIVAKAGKSIREIFEQDGEPAFRDLESAVVQDLATRQEHVIGLGGGAVLRPENRAALKAGGHKIVYLRCEPAELHKRISADAATAANRPSLTELGGGLAEIEKLLQQREPIYREVMDVELDVTALSVDEAMARLAKMI
ncbi:MAG TPA: shikimate kinase [Tepidisphaeraceae bacterium]|jgi:shikimate kinase|nr:shikimate kinase [Tepidisphaeraceae bacterium]